jgi:hypothetical protein
MEDNKWDAFLFVEKQKLKERDSVKDQTLSSKSDSSMARRSSSL